MVALGKRHREEVDSDEESSRCRKPLQWPRPGHGLETANEERRLAVHLHVVGGSVLSDFLFISLLIYE